MILRRALFQSGQLPICQCIRQLHYQIPARPIPSPTPFVPDVSTFLTVIGRGMSQHTAKISSWDALFSLTSAQLREAGVEPARNRRYLLQWLEKFRNSEYGIGGTAKEVSDGVAELLVIEAPVKEELQTNYTRTATATKTPGTRKMVVNVPAGKGLPKSALERVTPFKGVAIKGAHTVCGPHVEVVSGTEGRRGRIRVKEGLWEVKRGHKIDGGERRRAEVRAKRKAAANKER